MCELVHSFVEAVATPIKVSVAPSPGAAGRVASTPTTVPNDNGIPKTPLKSCVEPSSVEAGPFVASGCEAVPDNRVIPESTPVKSRGGEGSSPGEAASCAGSTPTTVPFEVVLPTPMKPCVSSSPADAATPPHCSIQCCAAKVRGLLGESGCGQITWAFDCRKGCREGPSVGI